MAENLVDSWLAPLLAYSFFGLPGAYAYRALNTADAMWGYRTPRYEHLGKAAARLDDILNFVPARLAALVLCVLAGPRWRAALTTWLRDEGVRGRRARRPVRKRALLRAGWPLVPTRCRRSRAGAAARRARCLGCGRAGPVGSNA